MHFAEIAFERDAVLDDAHAGSGVEVGVGEGGLGDVAGEIANGTAAGRKGEGEIEGKEVAVAVGEEGGEDIAVILGAGIEDAGRRGGVG